MPTLLRIHIYSMLQRIYSKGKRRRNQKEEKTTQKMTRGSRGPAQGMRTSKTLGTIRTLGIKDFFLFFPERRTPNSVASGTHDLAEGKSYRRIAGSGHLPCPSRSISAGCFTKETIRKKDRSNGFPRRAVLEVTAPIRVGLSSAPFGGHRYRFAFLAFGFRSLPFRAMLFTSMASSGCSWFQLSYVFLSEKWSKRFQSPWSLCLMWRSSTKRDGVWVIRNRHTRNRHRVFFSGDLHLPDFELSASMCRHRMRPDIPPPQRPELRSASCSVKIKIDPGKHGAPANTLSAPPEKKP